MDIDDELCLCFHVTKRKVISYIRIEKPRRPSQLANCYGAGTGCGWCRPFLKRLFEQLTDQNQESAELPSKREYALERRKYVEKGGGTPPPGATPIDEEIG